jgi:hypothetical protein
LIAAIVGRWDSGQRRKMSQDEKGEILIRDEKCKYY